MTLQSQIKTLARPDNHQIEIHRWIPAEPHRVIVLSHGMAEHLGRYEVFIEACLEQNIAVYGANHRGHGEKAPIKGHFADQGGWQLVLEDLDCVIETAAEEQKLQPVLLGHSMGSFVARHYAILNSSKLGGLILSGTNQQPSILFSSGLIIAKLEALRIGKDKPSPLLEKITFGDFNKRFEPIRTEQDWVCDEPEVIDGYINDPLCGFTCTPAFWIDFLTGLSTLTRPSEVARIRSDLPILMLTGSDDPVTRYGKGPEQLKALLEKTGCSNVTNELLAGKRHETLNMIRDTRPREVVFDWLKAC